MFRTFWFSGHCHVLFEATIPACNHSGFGVDENSKAQGKSTKFVAIDKCIKHRDYLRFESLEAYIPKELWGKKGCDLSFAIEYDIDWLAILKVTDSLYYEGMNSALKKLQKGDNIQQNANFF